MRDHNTAPPEPTILKLPGFIADFVGRKKVPQSGSGSGSEVNGGHRQHRFPPDDYENIQVPTTYKTLGRWLQIFHEIDDHKLRRDPLKYAMMYRFRHVLTSFPTLNEIEDGDRGFWPYRDDDSQGPEPAISPSPCTAGDKDWETMSAPSEHGYEDALSDTDDLDDVDEPLFAGEHEPEHDDAEENTENKGSPTVQHASVDATATADTDDLPPRVDHLQEQMASLQNQVKPLLISASAVQTGESVGINQQAAYPANVISSHLGQPPMFPFAPTVPRPSQPDMNEETPDRPKAQARVINCIRPSYRLQEPTVAIEQTASRLLKLEGKVESLGEWFKACVTDTVRVNEVADGHKQLSGRLDTAIARFDEIIVPSKSHQQSIGDRLERLEERVGKQQAFVELQDKAILSCREKFKTLEKKVGDFVTQGGNPNRSPRQLTPIRIIDPEVDRLSLKIERLDAKVDHDEIKIDSLVSQFWRHNDNLNKALVRIDTVVNDKNVESAGAPALHPDLTDEVMSLMRFKDKAETELQVLNETVNSLYEDSKKNFAELEGGHEANRLINASCHSAVQDWAVATKNMKADLVAGMKEWSDKVAQVEDRQVKLGEETASLCTRISATEVTIKKLKDSGDANGQEEEEEDDDFDEEAAEKAAEEEWEGLKKDVAKLQQEVKELKKLKPLVNDLYKLDDEPDEEWAGFKTDFADLQQDFKELNKLKELEPRISELAKTQAEDVEGLQALRETTTQRHEQSLKTLGDLQNQVTTLVMANDRETAERIARSKRTESLTVQLRDMVEAHGKLFRDFEEHKKAGAQGNQELVAQIEEAKKEACNLAGKAERLAQRSISENAKLDKRSLSMWRALINQLVRKAAGKAGYRFTFPVTSRNFPPLEEGVQRLTTINGEEDIAKLSDIEISGEVKKDPFRRRPQ